MSSPSVNLRSQRARQARLGHLLGRHTFSICLWLSAMLIGDASLIYTTSYQRLSYFAWAAGLLSFMIGLWYRNDLTRLPINGLSLDQRLSAELLGRLNVRQPLTPQSVWHSLKDQSQTVFLTNHLLLPTNMIEQQLSTDQTDMDAVWQEAIRLADLTNCQAIEPGHLAAATLNTSPSFANSFKAT